MAKINSDKTIVTVEKGDTLSEIARDYGQYMPASAGSTINDKVDYLCKINGIPNKNVIGIGQKIKLTGSEPAKNTSNLAIVNYLGLISTEDERSVYATWTWDNSKTDHYEVYWAFYVDGKWHKAHDEPITVKSKYSTYNAPSYATSVKVKVKPISKTKKDSKGNETYEWKVDWSTEKKYSFSNNPPGKPPVPTVTIDGYKLTAELTNLDINATEIAFQVYKDNESKVSSGRVPISVKAAAYTCTVSAGGSYTVRCRAYRGEEVSDWTEFSSPVLSAPAAPKSIKTLKALSSTEVQIDWANVTGADQYEVQWTTKKRYFDSGDVQSKTYDAEETGHAEITGLEPGQEYFFRVRALIGDQESPWSEIKSIVIGKAPSAPTTWSSKTTVISGETVLLYWVHNTEDGSTQKEAQVEITINGKTTTTDHVTVTGEEEEERTYFQEVNTASYTEGTKILWRVRTKGITDDYSEWSAQRTIDVYGTPELYLSATDVNGNEIGTIRSFPFYIKASDVTDSNNQKPIGYHVSVIATEAYETADQIGKVKMVNRYEAVYSKYFDTSDDLIIEMSAGNIDLANNELYRIKCVMSMDSGLTAEAEDSILVSWDEEYYVPNAMHTIDKESAIVHICPYCKDENENLVDDVLLSVYRREFDGSFTEIKTGIANNGYTWCTDLHPSLDYARYRIVATTKSTGSVKFHDMPGIPMNEKAVIIQWAEQWSTFETSEDGVSEEPSWTGSLLRLPYNIDVSDSNKPDVALIEYIGREHPVSYYGTQLGSTSTWNVVIPKNDTETLYALRRLSIWMGDVYVREPSGSGYWANINVSFSQKHRDLTIPVTLNITRVAGGA